MSLYEHSTDWSVCCFACRLFGPIRGSSPQHALPSASNLGDLGAPQAPWSAAACCAFIPRNRSQPCCPTYGTPPHGQQAGLSQSGSKLTHSTASSRTSMRSGEPAPMEFTLGLTCYSERSARRISFWLRSKGAWPCRPCCDTCRERFE